MRPLEHHVTPLQVLLALQSRVDKCGCMLGLAISAWSHDGYPCVHSQIGPSIVAKEKE